MCSNNAVTLKYIHQVCVLPEGHQVTAVPVLSLGLLAPPLNLPALPLSGSVALRREVLLGRRLWLLLRGDQTTTFDNEQLEKLFKPRLPNLQ